MNARSVGEPVRYTENTLLVWVDDTGHEELANTHPVYGLGGCAVLGRHYDVAVVQPWRAVRLAVNGSADLPLHASKFGRGATPEHLQVVERFFQTGGFMRFGCVAASTTTVAEPLTVMAAVIATLKARIADIAKWSPFDSLALIIEHSDRANFLVAQHFGDFGMTVDGKAIPIERGFMPKSANEPGLEVADFVANAVGGQGRRMLVGNRKDFGADFCATFHSIDPRFASFTAINDVMIQQMAPQPG